MRVDLEGVLLSTSKMTMTAPVYEPAEKPVTLRRQVCARSDAMKRRRPVMEQGRENLGNFGWGRVGCWDPSGSVTVHLRVDYIIMGL